jgi:hypothetical protein
MSVTRIQLRRGTSTQWASSNDVILAAGEIGFETDTNHFKIGNGDDTWEQLSYFKNVDELNSLSDNNLSNYATVSQLSSYILSNKIGANNGVASLDSSGQVPTSQLANIIGGASAAYDTLGEIAAILEDQEDLDALLTEIGTKVSDTGDTIKGDLIVQNSDSPGTGVGQVTANRLRLLSTGEATLTSTDHALQIGADNATKIKLDQNEIQAVSSANGTNSLALNPHGGDVTLGAGLSAAGSISTSGSIFVQATGASLNVGTGGISTTGKITSIQPIVDISANHTAASTNKFALIRSTAGAVNVTVTSTSLAKGERMDFVQWGAGQITFVASGVTLGSNGNKLKTNGQYAAVSLIKVDDTTGYLLVGNLVA